MTEKLQKVLARAGFGSRRHMETWISEGRVRINNAIAKLGDRVSERDAISVDGRAVPRERLSSINQTLMLHKVPGTVCSRSDPEGRETVFKGLPKLSSGRWISVGRLDINTTGLLLMTTDGELANRLMHPSYELDREYMVRVLGEVKPETIKKLTHGVELEDGPARFTSIVDTGGEGANHWYRVVVKEGRYREVRRLWESQGIQVSRLSRIRFGPVNLPRNLRRGQYEPVPAKVLEQLYQSVGLRPEPVKKKPERSVTHGKKLHKKQSRRVKSRGSPYSRK